MRMVDIIEKKRDGFELSEEEIQFFITGLVNQEIPTYQASALLMAIYFKGMTAKETACLTRCMLESGDKIDLSDVKGIKADKHSTGGVGDKTSLVVGPVCAACGLTVAKLSGRGLGHTGGTLDKLESIPGMSIAIDEDKFKEQVNNIGVAIVGQTKKLVPADKILYALRDVTGTVPSVPLIASSIMSKKLASGADLICLDVKVGSGAFMKTLDNAVELSHAMVDIGKACGRKVSAILTSMEQPLGLAVGNSLEVIEAINTLHDKGPEDFTKLCKFSCAHMLYLAGLYTSIESAMEKVNEVILNGEAFNKLVEMVKWQGGDVEYIKHPELFEKAKYIYALKSEKDGYIEHIDALQIGEYAMKLGAGRETMDDIIDNAAGIVLNKKVGDHVNKDEILCYVHTNKDNYLEIIKGLKEQFRITNNSNARDELILKVID